MNSDNKILNVQSDCDKLSNNKGKLIVIGILTVIGIVMSIVDYNIIYVEPIQTKAKMTERIHEMLQTNQTYEKIMDQRNYIDGVGFVWFQYYDGRMHHSSMTFQDLNGRILGNADRNYQYFKEIMGDPLNES